MISRRRMLGLAAAFTAGMRTVNALEASGVAPTAALKGRIYFKGEPRYEDFRAACSWNARKADRYPEAVVLAQNEADVVAAVKLARQRGWQVGTRSGGHSWNSTHTRDHALLINLARMKELSVDATARVAVVSPAWQGHALNKVLREQHGLVFPAAHCVGVGLGGFVLSGGHGWNQQVFGLACENLLALDLVTADGRLIHADENTNSDFYWAARGAGPGFFGVAVRFYLRLHPLPSHVRGFTYIYPEEVGDELVAWFDRLALLDYMEAGLMRASDNGRHVWRIRAGSFGNSDAEAAAATALYDSCPVLSRALVRQADVPSNLPADAESPNELSPTGARYSCDGAWVNASITRVHQLLKDDFAEDFPSVKSRVQMGRWRARPHPDMAYSVTGEVYVSPTAVYYEPRDDARCAAWVRQIVERVRPVAVGAQINDENIPANPGPYFSAQAAARLEKLRTQHDPERRFVSFLG